MYLFDRNNVFAANRFSYHLHKFLSNLFQIRWVDLEIVCNVSAWKELGILFAKTYVFV